MLNRKIEKLTSKLLDDLKVDKLPIPINKIAESRGLSIKPYDLGADVSGVLVIEGGRGTIGINPTESAVRQRFTIAHELGHFELHNDGDELFVDKGFKVLFRDQNSSKGEIKKEQEANAFAAALLMPEKLIREEVQKHSFDLTDEDSMKKLAKAFNVSVPAMTFRISNLRLF
ncbi:MAG TPA: ImmA/IrrE family metallo-endopeptidase [Flavisolibacter sp.]|nr:ImmA/IrrE family metallo-endopeptidase [Flavisolibacter sp.]